MSEKIYLISHGVDQKSIEYAKAAAVKNNLDVVFVDSANEVPDGITCLVVPEVLNIKIEAPPIPDIRFMEPVKPRKSASQPWSKEYKRNLRRK